MGDPIPLSDIVRNVNRSLRGWANYVHYRNSSLAMNKVYRLGLSGHGFATQAVFRMA
jgi:hypothetical protein